MSKYLESIIFFVYGVVGFVLVLTGLGTYFWWVAVCLVVTCVSFFTAGWTVAERKFKS